VAPRARPKVQQSLTTLASVAAVAFESGAADALYPTGTGSVDEQLEAVRRTYRRLAVIVHPDQNRDRPTLAARTFTRITELRQQREEEIEERGAPALPARGGFASRRAGTGSIVRSQPAAPVVAHDDGYDDAAPPPLPACACVDLARATLPGRVVFCTRAGQDWAVRTSDQRAVAVQHAADCERYRWANPNAVIEHGLVMQTSAFSVHSPGWCWAHARLTQRAARDPFAR
jgi:hypothetical protein